MHHRTFKAAGLANPLYPLLACAQTAELKMPSSADLGRNARESVDLNIGPFGLGVLGWMMDDHDPQSGELKTILQGLESVHVRSYQFGSDFLYPEAAID